MEDMVNHIGFLSGDIYKLLCDYGESSILTIKSKLNISNTVAYMAMGWLLREGKIYIRKDKDDYMVGLTTCDI